MSSKRPKSKEFIEDSDTDSSDDSDVKVKSKKKEEPVKKKKHNLSNSEESDADYEDKPKKKEKKEKTKKHEKKEKPAPKKQKQESDSEDDKKSEWQLSKNRKVVINEFKGKMLVDIREYYDAGGEMKPGRKGISLNREQWDSLLSVVDQVNNCLK